LVPVLLGAGAIAMWCGRLLVAAHEAVGVAENALARGDQTEATRAYLDALRSYVPGSPLEARALDGLDAMASAAADARDYDGERRALEAIRAGLLGARSLFVPYPTRLAKTNRRLAELDSDVAFPPSVRPATIVAPRIHSWGPRGGNPARVGVGSTLLALAGFAAWVGAVVLFVRRGLQSGFDVDAARSPRVSPLMTRVLVPVLFVVGFALFLVGLRRA